MAKKYETGKLENGLFYDDKKILQMYNDARDKNEQIKILAQLNLCKVDDIKQALIRAGMDRLENGLYHTDADILDMYNKHQGDKRFCLDKMAKMNECTVEDIKKALLRAGLNFRNLPRKRKSDNDTDKNTEPIKQEKSIPVEINEEPLDRPVVPVTIDGPILQVHTDTITHTKLLEFVQNAVCAYQDTLIVKKNNLESQIQELENHLTELRTELETCISELNVSKHMFN